jgi:uncharacterized protein
VATHKCPICKKAVEAGGIASPFCSERCRLIDLGNWLDGRYRIPGEPVELPPATSDESEETD